VPFVYPKVAVVDVSYGTVNDEFVEIGKLSAGCDVKLKIFLVAYALRLWKTSAEVVIRLTENIGGEPAGVAEAHVQHGRSIAASGVR
jgi:hypothetical protein